MAIERIINVLKELDLEHQKLIESGEHKKKAIIANEIDRIISLVNQESKIVKQIEVLEEERSTSINLFLKEKGIKSNLKLNLKELSRLVFEPEDKSRLHKVHLHLNETLNKLKELNDINQQLIQQAISYIDFSIETLKVYPEQEAFYQHPSDKNHGLSSPGVFDSRA
ncbi:flagellar protein FlgN [Paenibacillus crassostreae]|uniref:Flagellar biosynthesis protein FlgN n=1 Tax=Paenibacillus crassostreae TaxID=1763538 RepID=A0A162RQQ5_9BACL|nr:flagellar protein FlgN [Paenibacillus crassostreae]AOZ93234.1 flagellar biosynthesis protein FlgN [Paenibacillus crassostreae]OAB74057.1 flagellar biosynthesis protein FlgN [Paenibacillus crassostreae]